MICHSVSLSESAVAFHRTRGHPTKSAWLECGLPLVNQQCRGLPDFDLTFLLIPIYLSFYLEIRSKGQVMPRSLLLGSSAKTHEPLPCDLCRGAGQVELTKAETYYEGNWKSCRALP